MSKNPITIMAKESCNRASDDARRGHAIRTKAIPLDVRTADQKKASPPSPKNVRTTHTDDGHLEDFLSFDDPTPWSLRICRLDGDNRR